MECVSTLFQESKHPEVAVIEVPDEEAIETTRELIG